MTTSYAGAQGANADNVVPHPAVRRPRIASAIADATRRRPSTAPSKRRTARPFAAGEFEIALQPIVSVSSSAASGFEVFASLPVEGGERVDLRRLAEALPGVEAAVFERILVDDGAEAGRKRLGAASAAMPLHVAISDAILVDAKELAPLLDMLQFYPDLAKSIVLSIPVGLLDAAGDHQQALGLLSAERASASPGRLERTRHRQFDRRSKASTSSRSRPIACSTAKSSAASSSRPRRSSKARRPTSAIIAVDVANDEDAVSLIDLGIDLMAGPRFGGPRRLKPDGSSRPGRLALI